MKFDPIKKKLHWVGTGLGVLGVVFVAFKLAEYGNQIDFSGFGAGVLLTASGLAVVYGFANLLLALAWHDLLHHVSIESDRRWAIRTYGQSQLAKYVPGNIFHLAGRQAIGMAKGLPGRPLVKSAIWELAVIAVAGGLFSIPVLFFFAGQTSSMPALAAFTMSVLFCAWTARRRFSTWVARALIWYTIFLTVSGLLFTIILLYVSSNLAVPSIAIAFCGSYVIAWLAGLLTPGAPAGVGVREFVLYALLHTYVSKGDLLAAILLGRMVTVSGDLFFYFAAVFVVGDAKRKFFERTQG